MIQIIVHLFQPQKNLLIFLHKIYQFFPRLFLSHH
jgi:hypothetical protein